MSPQCGFASVDTGNPIWCVEDPFVTLETLAPYVVTTHVRDSVVFEDARGAAGQWVALGDGNVDLARFVREFRRLCPNSSISRRRTASSSTPRSGGSRSSSR